MRELKELIIVPYWVQEVLNRNKLDLSEALDFSKIRKFFSVADLAGWLSVQDKFNLILGTRDVLYPSFGLFVKWDQSSKCQDDQEFLSNTLRTMSQDPAFYEGAHARLFDPANKRAEDVEPFITYDLAPDVGAIVIYPGHFTATPDVDLHYRALVALLKALYVYTPYSEVSKSVWFTQYLKKLTSKELLVA